MSKAHPAISHCSHLLLKCRVATNISHWLKVQSRLFKNYIFAIKVYFDQLLDFPILLLLFLHTLLVCNIFLFGCWMFSIPSGCQTRWIQIRPDILSGLIWVSDSFTILGLWVLGLAVSHINESNCKLMSPEHYF